MIELSEISSQTTGPRKSLGPRDSDSLVSDLSSILERIDLSRLFPTPQPLEVELGSGDASFLVAYASQHPERNFIGVERLLGRIRKLDRKGRRAGLTNLRGVRIESSYFLEYLLPPHSVSALHVYFPDPWPKRKHLRYRLVSEKFPLIAHQALSAGGVVYFRTDHPGYYEQIQAVFESACDLFESHNTPAELSALFTDFERDFQTNGVVTLRAGFSALPKRYSTA